MPRKKQGFDESAEMYLKTIAELSAESDPVPVTLVASRLGISTVSASEMVHKLEDQELLEHTPYKGVRMTEKGFLRANTIIRRHQLWEVFLFEKLGLSWAATHELACKLEHVPSTELDEALDRFLGSPERCPHGNLIPRTGDTPRVSTGKPLNQFEAGQWVLIENVPIEESALLNDLEAAGLVTGVRIKILDQSEPGAGFRVLCKEQPVTIAEAVASKIIAMKEQ